MAWDDCFTERAYDAYMGYDQPDEPPYAVASIGNGLYCRTTSRESLLDAYRRKQATCKHPQRDPKGMCYECGQVEKEGV